MEGIVFLILVFGLAALVIKGLAFLLQAFLFILLLPFKLMAALFAGVISIFAGRFAAGVAVVVTLGALLLAPLLILLIPIPIVIVGGLSLLMGLLPFVGIALAAYGLYALLKGKPASGNALANRP